MPNRRDDFSKDTKDTLAARVCMRCSRCQSPTAGPTTEAAGRVMIGVAAHICGASSGGPRFDANQTKEQRRSIENGIWLCTGCAKLIDDDEVRFPVQELFRLKREAERRARDELALPPERTEKLNWQSLQLSKIATYAAPIRLPTQNDNKGIDKEVFEKFSDQFNQLISIAFGHACVTTPYDDFVYVLSIEKDSRDCETGYVPFVLSLHCHVTAFIWAFEQLAKVFFEGTASGVPNQLRSLPGDQAVDVHPQFERFVPHRICRTGATKISIQHLAERPIPLDNGASTSVLLRILAVTLNSNLLIWDNADSSPDWEKVVEMLAKISDANRFKWDDFELDRNDPEKWKYVGNR